MCGFLAAGVLCFLVQSAYGQGGPCDGIIDCENPQRHWRVPTVEWEANHLYTREGSHPNVRLVLKLTDITQEWVDTGHTIRVRLVESAGSAQNGVDYQLASETLGKWHVLSSRYPWQGFAFSAVDDSRVEGDEYASYCYEVHPDDGASYYGAPRACVTIDIEDNDIVQARIAVAPTTIVEGGTAHVTVSVAEPVDQVLVLDVKTRHGTADADDYREIDRVVSFGGSKMSETFFLRTTEDNVVEGDETLSVQFSISPVSPRRLSECQCPPELDAADHPG